ncbi:MAG: bifunctional nuclease family protein [bacterium]|jgi:bifunctional DNase/RNase
MAVIELEVKVLVQNEGGGFTVLLTDKDQRYVLPIVIGPTEAYAIALPLQGTSYPRPLPHDLLLDLCGQLDLSLKEVVITDVKENTFFAEVRLLKDGEEVVLDSRPSDAIALAVRAGAPIYMTNRLLEFTLNFHDITFKNDGSGAQGLH